MQLHRVHVTLEALPAHSFDPNENQPATDPTKRHHTCRVAFIVPENRTELGPGSVSLADDTHDGGVAKSQPRPVESEVLPPSEETSDTSKHVSCGLIYSSDGIQMILGWF